MENAILKKAVEPFQRCFWKTQISILRTCPPLGGLVVKFSMGAANSPQAWMKMLLRLLVQAPQAVFLHCRDKLGGRVVLSRVAVIVTTRCTLNCDKCVEHIPDLKIHEDMPVDELIADIHSLLSCVDYIHGITLVGGEVFLYPHLSEVLRAVADSEKVGGINLQTNGTVIPDAKTLAAVKEAKAFVQISKYARTLQPDVEELKKTLRGSGIPHMHTGGTSWSDMAGLGPGVLEEGSAKQRFSVCAWQLCFPCYKGKLHRCGESAIMMGEGFIPVREEDYIDLRAAGPAAFRGQLQKLLKKRAVSACAYCLGNTYKTPKVPVAVQREPNTADRPYASQGGG